MDVVSGAMVVAAGGAGGLAFAVALIGARLFLKWFLGRRCCVRNPYDRHHVVLGRDVRPAVRDDFQVI